MVLDTAQKVLYGGSEKFPRRVGVPYQWYCFSEGEFDLYVDRVNGHSNAYAAICYRDEEWGLWLDKVSIDLDTPMKEDDEWLIFDDSPPDDEVIERMRSDPELAEDILHEVCEDVNALAEKCEEDGVPVIGVYSGFGIHFHMLHQPRKNPADAVKTTSRKYLREASVRTFDGAVVGDVKRILRVPNCERVHVSENDEHRRGCGLYTIPLTRDELKDITAQDLMLLSSEPRDIPEPNDDRPPLEHYDEYDNGDSVGGDVPVEQQDVDEAIVDNEAIRFLLEEYLQMPCMYERIMQSNPDHRVRRNCAVLLFNIGLEPDEVHNLYAQIGWIDYDPSETQYQLEQIYQRGYSDMSCATIRDQGLCTRVDEPKECPCFGWSGGDVEWK